ncbi:MAG: Cell division protein FtsZ [candidate division WS2 bacterium]|nr:Cell division protein FtsZ [Candidatus Lithacetigena glycinireducens]
MSNFQPQKEFNAKIRVVGIGGAGGNAINRMISLGLKGVDFIAMNTDVQALRKNKARGKVQLGPETTGGLGAGSDPVIGEKSAEESIPAIREALKGSNLVFITCGMGGGTGTGGAPIVAEIASELNALVVAVVTRPFNFEGSKRLYIAECGINKIKDLVDSLIVVINDRVLHFSEEKLTMLDAFKKVDEVLYHGVAGISEMITEPSLVNVDFNDAKNILTRSGVAHMGIGIGKGENAAREAVEKAIKSPLLETAIRGSSRVMFYVKGDENLKMNDLNMIGNTIREEAHREALIIFGANVSKKFKDRVQVTVVASEMSDKNTNPPPKNRSVFRFSEIHDIEVPNFLKQKDE